MSFRDGRYLTLSGLAHDAWTELASKSDALRPSAEVSAALQQDLDSLHADLERRHLIERESADEARAPAHTAPRWRGDLARRLLRLQSGQIPGRFTCLAVLCGLHAALWTIGLRRVLRYIFSIPETAQPAANPHEWLARAAARIDRAGMWYPFEARCLERSLCLMLLGRLSGAAVDLRLGVLPAPFMAHAWVEHSGTPVNDTPEHLRVYVPFPPIRRDMVA